MALTLLEPSSAEDFQRYYDLRWKVLRAPWNQPKGSEKDDIERESIHVMVCETDRIPVGVGRAHFDSTTEAQIRYMAVDETCQGQGVGGMVLRELERRIKQNGRTHIFLNARENAVDFYKKHGYQIVGDGHTLFGEVRHWKMEKII